MTDLETCSTRNRRVGAPPAIEVTNVSKKFLLGARSTLHPRSVDDWHRRGPRIRVLGGPQRREPHRRAGNDAGRHRSQRLRQVDLPADALRHLPADHRNGPTRGRVTALRELGAGFHPELSGRENVYMNGAVVGLSRDDMDDVMDEIISIADIGSFIDAPIETYSSGMRARLGFAVTIQLRPEILLADEMAVGDITFKEHGARRMQRLREHGATIVQVSHNL